MARIISCGSDALNAQLNTGTKGFKSRGKVVKYILAKSDQKFENVADFKDETKHNDFAKTKDIVYFFEIEKPENANTEDTFLESAINKEISQEGKKIKKFRHELNDCDYKALKSYENSDYTRIYEITSKGFIKGIANDDGSIHGMDIKQFLISQYEEATTDAFESATVEVIYKDRDQFINSPAVVKPNFDVEQKNGIFEVGVEVVSASDTELQLKLTVGCCGDALESLVLADFKLVKTDGTAQTITASSQTDGLYILTGTGLVTGVLSTDGVIVKTNAMYEINGTVITI